MRAFSQDVRFTRSADGTRLAYAVHGRGFPLVRAAHWLTNIDLDWRTPMWRPWFDAFGERYRFHRYDSRGCGLSDRDATDASLDVLVTDLEAVVDAAKLERFALLGISQGGAVSIAYAVRHPERVSHLVLLGAFARGPLRRGPTPDELESFHAQVKLIEPDGVRTTRRSCSCSRVSSFRTRRPSSRSFNDLQRMSCSPPHAAQLVATFSDIDASPYSRKSLPDAGSPHARRHVRALRRRGLHRVVDSWRAAGSARDPQPRADAGRAVVRARDRRDRSVRRRRARRGAFPALTRRERQILEHIARGLDNAQIAAHLDLSEKTVRNHITAIFDKIGVENRAQAIVQAREAGLTSSRGGESGPPSWFFRAFRS